MSENLTNKRSFVHQANRKREEASDLAKKWRIVKLLKKHFEIIALGMVDEFYYCRDRSTNEFMIDRSLNETPEQQKHQMVSRYQINKIDLFIKTTLPHKIIEIDGLEHGLFDEITETQQTTDRNLNYGLGGFTEKDKTLIILTKNDMELNDEFLVQVLAEKLGVKRLR